MNGGVESFDMVIEYFRGFGDGRDVFGEEVILLVIFF